MQRREFAGKAAAAVIGAGAATFVPISASEDEQASHEPQRIAEGTYRVTALEEDETPFGPGQTVRIRKDEYIISLAVEEGFSLSDQWELQKGLGTAGFHGVLMAFPAGTALVRLERIDD